MHPMLNIAIRAIRKGGNIIAQNYDAQKFIKEDFEKKQYFIKKVMYKTYQTISEIIYKYYPNHIIIKKNTNYIFNDKKILWIINELDGKKNFIKNFPHFCISIAVIIKKNTEISVIYDPIKNDLFTSVRGQGSQLNGYRTRCANINSLSDTTISTNLIFQEIQFKSYFKIYKKLILSGISFRYTGSTLLDLAYVSSGRIDCLIVNCDSLNSPNFIAGQAQALESGCLTSNFQEKNVDLNLNLTSSSKFIKLITEKIRECYVVSKDITLS
ncbi:inositol monophosphatase [Buchnera aphidicola (Aphis helianthi)]|uniref:Inositol-1-monophosphatase n=1 Tax=Buchnera aphidicola (Aphis helianthi) TaxID=2315802 RepID=A0A4D6XQ22_9GAMM|nr:inositol monophosphatase family protein [Buchnera aphidicola]QCI17104.1 inositol monophosphatase [Buchnera aphidicola (Aphis helianthi)]